MLQIYPEEEQILLWEAWSTRISNASIVVFRWEKRGA
jgi:hypothetical protein